MLDLNDVPDCEWDPNLTPQGYGGLKVESYADWEERIGHNISNLHPEIREQWVHRHWTQSRMAFLPLETLTWREERWAPEKFLSEVKTWRGNEALDPEHDYNAFARPEMGGKHPTAVALDQGEWDYAPPVLCTPNGFIDTLGTVIDANYLLVEGHCRRRYLNALIERGQALEDQRVFVMESPMVV